MPVFEKNLNTLGTYMPFSQPLIVYLSTKCFDFDSDVYYVLALVESNISA